MFDIIGDVHGHAKQLEILLNKLGFLKKSGVYFHPEGRKCIFLGDYIDRGPNIRETLHIVKDMCDLGSAIAIMGNHEFNAICFHTKNPKDGGFFRKHKIKEIEQHIETLKQFKHFESEWSTIFLPWFHTLPIFLEFDSFRVVHACWDDNHIEWLKNNDIYTNENDQKKLKLDVLENYSNKRSTEYIVLEELLKGKEQKLSKEQSFLDKDGHHREDARIKWFNPVENRRLYHDIFLGIDDEFGSKPIQEESFKNLHSYESDVPVFFGHYWLKGKPQNPHSKSICLDYSVAKNGYLVAYRLDAKEFVSVK
jgi:hypothetical protein